MILPKQTTQQRPPPDFVATVFIIFLMAGGMALVDTCWSMFGLSSVGIGTAQAQETQTQQQAIDNLDDLLNQYDQGDLPVNDPRLTAAQAKITELEAALQAAQAELAALQATHAACP
jgi:uracil phosphoribosyltransferase